MRGVLRRLRNLFVALALSACVVALGALVPGRHGWPVPSARAAATFTVNSTGDGGDSNAGDGVCNDGSGNCTLRAAIQETNATPGADTVAFNIPGAGVRTIAPTSALPVVADSLTIDGYTQPGSSANTLADGSDAVLLVELSGGPLGSPGGQTQSGLVFGVGSSTVRGLVVNRFSGSGIVLSTSFNVVEGNFIGTSADGASDLGNDNGVAVSGAGNNRIGGSSPAARNLLSGNTIGVSILNSFSNSVRGNFIGTDASGTKAVGNGAGVAAGAGRHTIGGTTPADRNVISGNGTGVSLGGASIQLDGNTVRGNFIGTDVTGARPLGNFFGVLIGGTGHVIVGNVISASTDSGVFLTGNLAHFNGVSSNLIGTDATGTRPLGNGRHGIDIDTRPQSSLPGGTAVSANTIAFNAGSGVRVVSDRINPLRDNNVFSNGGLGIDLGFGPGVTPNDAGDGDTGANDLQNFPVITSAVSDGTTTTIQGTLSSTPNGSFTIQFFTNAACDPSGHGEGARFFGELTNVNANSSGNASFSAVVNAPLPAGRVVTATATFGTNTSEFSPCNAAGAAGSVEFSAAAYNVIEDVGDAVVRLVRTGGSAGTLTVNFTTDGGTAAAGADYTAVSTPVTFAPGETTKTVAVPVVNDGTIEPDETVSLVLSNAAEPDTVGARGRAALNIIDSSQRPTVSVSDVTVAEPLSGTTSAVFTVSLSAATSQLVSVNFDTADNTATSPADYSATSGTVFIGPGNTDSVNVSVPVNGDTLDEPDETFFVNLSNATGANVGDGQGVGTITNNTTPVLQFVAADLRANEGDHVFTVTVTRSGQTSGALTIDYATAPGTASDRKDYTTALGTLRFAPGETTRSFDVLLTDDGFQEGDETIQLALSNPAGGAVLAGQSTAVLTVADNDPAPSPTNPIDGAQLFVRQHYHDFLNREPDQAGLDFWVSNITSCGADAECVQVKRVNVSAAFFLSIEFQETGFLAYRTHKAAFGNLPNRPVPVRLRDFLAGTQEIGRGVEVGVGDWQARLEANKQTFGNAFVARPEFVARYPSTMTAAEFVDALNANAGGALSPAERDALVNDLNNGTKTRAQVLRAVAEDQTLKDAETNRAFVLMQYFGYLRRNPDDPDFQNNPDPQFLGYNFWLTKLNQFNGNYEQAEMVRAFIESIEYRERFR